MEKDVFTIIIPVYNAENYLKSCISSILNQTYQYFELILVDDGSSDGSGGICDGFAESDKRVRVIHQENRGVSHARNNGISVATGKWICFVDSDDEVKQDWLEHYVNNADADLLVQGVLEIIDNKKQIKISMPNLFVEGEERQNLHARKFNLNPPFKCFKTDIIRKNNLHFIEGMHSAEDLTFVLNYMIFSNSVRFIPYDGYIYNHQNSTLTRKFHSPDVRAEWRRTVFETILKMCKGNKSAPLYRSIVEQDFSFITQYVTTNYGKLTRAERYKLYQVLRMNYDKINILSMRWTRWVFILLPLPNKVFDNIVWLCSKVYGK